MSCGLNPSRCELCGGARHSRPRPQAWPPRPFRSRLWSLQTPPLCQKLRLLLLFFEAPGVRQPLWGPGGGWGLGPIPRGSASRRRPRPHATWLLGPDIWPCVSRSPSLGRAPSGRAGLAMPLPQQLQAGFVGRTAPLCCRAWEVAQSRRVFRELFLPPGGGGTQGAASRCASRCAQVRPGAGRPRLVHILAGRVPAPAPPGAADWSARGARPQRAPSRRPRPAGAGPPGAGPGRGPSAGARRSGFRGPGRLALYVNSSGSAPCSPRRR